MNILIIGCRLQGVEAVYLAKKAGFFTTAVDRDENACAVGLADKFVCGDFFDSCNYKFVLDATPVGGWISENDVCENAVYSVPGMPLSLTPKAAAKITLIHNPLELGTISMYYDCISRME